MLDNGNYDIKLCLQDCCAIRISQPFLRIMAVKTTFILNFFSYRMAPEHVFPIPVQDCVTATKYFLTNAASFNVDPARVAIGGKYDLIAVDQVQINIC